MVLVLYFYVLLMIILTFGLIKLLAGKKQPVSGRGEPLVSVVIAFRNEEANLPLLLKDLCNQSYGNFEVVFVDDDSSDRGAELIAKAKCDNFIVLRNPSGTGKKAALQYGLTRAKGEIILFTDADCRLPGDWIKSVVACMQSSGAGVCLGNVLLEEGRSFFSRLEALEFAALQASTLGAVGAGLAFMSNGADFAVKREVLSYADLNDRYASGDDVFLLQSALAHGYKVSACISPQCAVMTKGTGNLRDFLEQRIRWASKTGGGNMIQKIVALTVFGTNAFLLYEMFAAFDLFMIMLFVKFLADVMLVSVYLAKFKRLKLLAWAVILEFFYLFYAVYAGIASQIKGYEWKGRKYKR